MTTDVTPVDIEIRWAPWVPLEGCWRGTVIPQRPGLYRIRREGEERLDYIGQTGSGSMTLRMRLAMLRGVYGAEMPYRDPHTAAPSLWALRHAGARPFLVSVAVVDGPTPWRKGLEALEIAGHRSCFDRSPTVQFGRVPAGYRASSGNNARLVAAGLRFRGGPWPELYPAHAPGIPPQGPAGDDPHAEGWCGHVWSPWSPAAGAIREVPAGAAGLYRLRAPGRVGLLYIGEGAIVARVAAHLAKVRRPETPQGAVFAVAGRIEASWAVGQWLGNQRLELETDLIAAHLIATRAVPDAQFLG